MGLLSGLFGAIGAAGFLARPFSALSCPKRGASLGHLRGTRGHRGSEKQAKTVYHPVSTCSANARIAPAITTAAGKTFQTGVLQPLNRECLCARARTAPVPDPKRQPTPWNFNRVGPLQPTHAVLGRTGRLALTATAAGTGVSGVAARPLTVGWGVCLLCRHQVPRCMKQGRHQVPNLALYGVSI